MQYCVLGPLEVRGENGPLALGGEKQRALLALLLLNANRVVSRERLIDELWGEEPPETAVSMVQVYVSRLRKVLPNGVLSTRAPGYVMAVEPSELDLARFEQLVSAAREADPAQASRLLREGLALWRGPPLAEFEQEPFARGESRRVEDLRLAALEERIEADLALGRHADLAGELETLIAEYPQRERLCGQLMLALYRSDRQTEALAVYRDARGALDELGIEPSERLRRLEKQILTHDPALELAPQPWVEASGPVPLPGALVTESPFPFVGRAGELSTLHSLLERAEGGEGGLVLVSGEPGGGKTRLVRELALEAAGRGVLVCYGMSDAAVTVPYQPVLEWFEFLARVCEPEVLARCLGEGDELLPRLVPALRTLTGAAAQEPGPDSPIDRYQLQTAVVAFLRRLSATRPLLLVAEDLHWADGETLSLLGRLARMAPEARVMAVATFRQPGEEIGPELADALADLSRLDGLTRMPLDDLSADDLGAFVRSSAEAEASPELVAAIARLTDGTPLLVCELWRELVARKAVEVSDGQVTLLRPVAELRGARRIHELVEQRLSRLSPETVAMIELAAVAGPRFELHVIGAAAELDRPGLSRAFEQATRSGLVEELPEAEPAARFTHELVRRAVYDRIPRLRLPELHLRVGDGVEQAHAADLARVLPELAHHFTLAAPLAGAERAVDYNLRAAEAAMSSVAYREAAARLSTALDLGIEDPSERAGVQAELGHLLYETGRLAESDAIMAASLDTATSADERGLAARALVQRSNQRLASDPTVSSAEMVPVAEDAIRTFEQLGDALGLAMAEHLLGHALGREGRSAEALAALDRALAHAELAGDEVMGRHIIGRIARELRAGTTTAGEAIVRLEQLRSSSLNDPVLDAGLRRHLAASLAMAGRFEEARRHIAASDRVLEHAVETDLSLNSQWVVAEALQFTGDLAGAEQRFVGVFLRMRDTRGEAEARALRAAAQLALLLCDQRRWDEAESYLAYGGEVDGEMPVKGKVYSIYRFAAKGRLAAQRGAFGEALELARRAVEVADRGPLRQRPLTWLALAEVQRASGQAADADESVATAVALYEQKGNVAAAARVRLTAPTEPT